MSFFDFMKQFSCDAGERGALARELLDLSKKQEGEKVKDIDSFQDLLLVVGEKPGLRSSVALMAVNDSLWCEYCAFSGHSI